jgi:hypothetical protein
MSPNDHRESLTSRFHALVTGRACKGQGKTTIVSEQGLLGTAVVWLACMALFETHARVEGFEGTKASAKLKLI